MHCGAEGSVVGGSVVGGSVVGKGAVEDGSVAASVEGRSVAGAAVEGASVAVGASAVGCTDVCDSSGAEADIELVGVCGSSVVEGAVGVFASEDAAGSVCAVVGVCAVGTEIVISSPSGCRASPRKNAAASTPRSTTAAITAYRRFFILQGDGRASPPPVRGSPCPADQVGYRRCR